MSKTQLTIGISKAVVRWALRFVLLAFAVVVVAALVVTTVLPRATHGSALTVLTGSMTPAIPVGSVVVVRPVDPRTLQPGDIATYQVEEGEETFITHRVMKVHNEGEGLSFTFKGDANRGADIEPVPAGAVRGQVWFHVPYLGGIRDALHGKGGVTLFGMLLLAGYAISQVSAGLRERRTSRNVQASAIDFDAPVLLAEFNCDSTDRGSIDDVVSLISGLLVASDERQFAVLCRPSNEGLVAATELLRQFRPTRLVVLEAATLRGDGQQLEHPEPSTSQERAHALVDS